jgi:hypothetical protein
MREINRKMAKLPPNMTELSAYIDKELKLRFKLACTAAERSMSDVVTELIEGWLEQSESSTASTQAKESNEH